MQISCQLKRRITPSQKFLRGFSRREFRISHEAKTAMGKQGEALKQSTMCVVYYQADEKLFVWKPKRESLLEELYQVQVPQESIKVSPNLFEISTFLSFSRGHSSKAVKQPLPPPPRQSGEIGLGQGEIASGVGGRKKRRRRAFQVSDEVGVDSCWRPFEASRQPQNMANEVT